MNPTTETNFDTWTQQVWQGNPSLNLVCSVKYFKYKTRKIPVWIHGGTKEYQGFDFTVSAGANSDFSYTGRCVDSYELHQAEKVVDELAKKGKLIY